MAGAEEIVLEIVGNAHMVCYRDLQLAIHIAYECFPIQISMKELTEATALRLNMKKSAASVGRSLARAVDDIWDYGGREILQSKYGFRNKPTPKALIYRLARALQTPATYHTFLDTARQYGILAKSAVGEEWIAVAPFLVDEDKAAEITHALGELDVSLEEFRELLLNNGIALFIKE